MTRAVLGENTLLRFAMALVVGSCLLNIGIMLLKHRRAPEDRHQDTS